MSREMDDNAPHFDFKNSWFDLNVEHQVSLQFMFLKNLEGGEVRWIFYSNLKLRQECNLA